MLAETDESHRATSLPSKSATISVALGRVRRLAGNAAPPANAGAGGGRSKCVWQWVARVLGARARPLVRRARRGEHTYIARTVDALDAGAAAGHRTTRCRLIANGGLRRVILLAAQPQFLSGNRRARRRLRAPPRGGHCHPRRHVTSMTRRTWVDWLPGVGGGRRRRGGGCLAVCGRAVLPIGGVGGVGGGGRVCGRRTISLARYISPPHSAHTKPPRSQKLRTEACARVGRQRRREKLRIAQSNRGRRRRATTRRHGEKGNSVAPRSRA